MLCHEPPGSRLEVVSENTLVFLFFCQLSANIRRKMAASEEAAILHQTKQVITLQPEPEPLPARWWFLLFLWSF